MGPLVANLVPRKRITTNDTLPSFGDRRTFPFAILFGQSDILFLVVFVLIGIDSRLDNWQRVLLVANAMTFATAVQTTEVGGHGGERRLWPGVGRRWAFQVPSSCNLR